MKKLPEWARKIASEMYPQVSRNYSHWEVERLLIAVLNEALHRQREELLEELWMEKKYEIKRYSK